MKKDILQQIEILRTQLKVIAGPGFEELSTPDTWLELIRFATRDPNSDFKEQMMEVAAFALSAIEACSDENIENGFDEDETFALLFPPVSPPEVGRRFGPIDRQLG